MASCIIHLAVANEINKKLNKNKKQILLGSIAPDIAKLIGETKVKSHFLDASKNDSIPMMEVFTNKYRNYINNDFVLGYYIHLYTDYLWFKYFMTEIEEYGMIIKLNGEKVPLNDENFKKFVYNDYTNLNIQIIDKYNLDLKLFYESIPEVPNIIEEIPNDKLKILVDAMGIIIENSHKHKEYLFDMKNIETFIDTSVKFILSEIEKEGFLN